MHFLIFNGYQVAQSEQPIVYNPERRSWLLIDKNTEYSDFDGTTYSVSANPASPPPRPVPTSVTMRQARLALLGAGKLAGVTAAINALPSPQKEAAQIEWEYSQTVERNRGFVLLLGAALGLTDAQLDGLFVAAAGL